MRRAPRAAARAAPTHPRGWRCAERSRGRGSPTYHHKVGVLQTGRARWPCCGGRIAHARPRANGTVRHSPVTVRCARLTLHHLRSQGPLLLGTNLPRAKHRTRASRGGNDNHACPRPFSGETCHPPRRCRRKACTYGSPRGMVIAQSRASAGHNKGASHRKGRIGQRLRRCAQCQNGEPCVAVWCAPVRRLPPGPQFPGSKGALGSRWVRQKASLDAETSELQGSNDHDLALCQAR